MLLNTFSTFCYTQVKKNLYVTEKISYILDSLYGEEIQHSTKRQGMHL